MKVAVVFLTLMYEENMLDYIITKLVFVTKLVFALFYTTSAVRQ